MPLRLNLGLSKKVGLPAYGSLGASCHLELELDQSLLDSDLDGFHQRVRRIYAACRQAVYEELARQQDSPPWEDSPETTGEHGNETSHSTMASAKQIEYAEQLARQIRGLGFRRLEALAQKLHEKPLAALSSSEASALIDVLKELKTGTIEVAEVLNGAAE